METEILGISNPEGVRFEKTAGLRIILGAVLPIYPILFVIHQRIGRYDEIVEEFKRLREEHERMKEVYYGI
jgi:hypothetical protein